MQAMQLDIFDHSRDTMLLNDVADALERRDTPTAQSAWRSFAAEFPAHEALPPLRVLVEALGQVTRESFPDHDAVRDARRVMSDDIEPAARRIFGEKVAAAWLAPFLRETAQRAARLAFRAERSDDHAAPLWLRAGDWATARDTVAGIESWRRIPAPLAWMAEARYRIDGLDAAWPLLAELAWLSSVRFDHLTARLADPLLQRLRKRFDASFEGDGDLRDLAWLPAWVLTEKPALSAQLGQAQPSLHTPPEQALRLLLEILGLERQGRHHEMVVRRKALRDLHPALYMAYMATR